MARSTCPVKAESQRASILHACGKPNIAQASAAHYQLSIIFHTWHEDVSFKHALRPCCLAEQCPLDISYLEQAQFYICQSGYLCFPKEAENSDIRCYTSAHT